MTEPTARVTASAAFGQTVQLSGSWTLPLLGSRVRDLSRTLSEYGSDPKLAWDLSGVNVLDSTGAVLIWRAWGRERPAQVVVKPEHDAALRRLVRVSRAPAPGRTLDFLEPIAVLGRQEAKLLDNAIGFSALIGYVVLDLLHLITHPGAIPWREVSASIYKAGTRALPVTAIVGFLIGVVVSYLFALTLRTYGAGLYIIDILGISIIRELGPLLAAILVAGRSGSAMTAQIGVMRVTEEIDAMIAMGLSPTLRLVLPKVIGLAIAMPLVSVWVVAAALFGGWTAAYVLLGISFPYFFETLPSAVHPDNLWIATLKSFSFGIGIALAACHFGLRVRPNTESVSAGITASVVTSITLMILLDAVYAIIFKDVGFMTP
jgi:phospholipid/cholesterol/gamma-HCH transport system permease protein